MRSFLLPALLALPSLALAQGSLTPPGVSATPQEHYDIPIGKADRVRFHSNGRITNDWGVGFWDDQGSHTGHKQYARQH